MYEVELIVLKKGSFISLACLLGLGISGCKHALELSELNMENVRPNIHYEYVLESRKVVATAQFSYVQRRDQKSGVDPQTGKKDLRKQDGFPIQITKPYQLILKKSVPSYTAKAAKEGVQPPQGKQKSFFSQAHPDDLQEFVLLSDQAKGGLTPPRYQASVTYPDLVSMASPALLVGLYENDNLLHEISMWGAQHVNDFDMAVGIERYYRNLKLSGAFEAASRVTVIFQNLFFIKEAKETKENKDSQQSPANLPDEKMNCELGGSFTLAVDVPLDISRLEMMIGREQQKMLHDHNRCIEQQGLPRQYFELDIVKTKQWKTINIKNILCDLGYSIKFTRQYVKDPAFGF
jgi:hypothetical protein